MDNPIGMYTRLKVSYRDRIRQFVYQLRKQNKDAYNDACSHIEQQVNFKQSKYRKIMQEVVNNGVII